MPGFLQLSAIPPALKREKLLKTWLMQFSLISAARHLARDEMDGMRRNVIGGSVAGGGADRRSGYEQAFPAFAT